MPNRPAAPRAALECEACLRESLASPDPPRPAAILFEGGNPAAPLLTKEGPGEFSSIVPAPELHHPIVSLTTPPPMRSNEVRSKVVSITMRRPNDGVFRWLIPKIQKGVWVALVLLFPGQIELRAGSAVADRQRQRPLSAAGRRSRLFLAGGHRVGTLSPARSGGSGILSGAARRAGIYRDPGGCSRGTRWPHGSQR